MKRMILILSLLLVLPVGANAREVADMPLEQAVTVNNQALKLNGYGIRKKFFVKVYIGALYAGKRLATVKEVLNDRGDKLIRMKFLHSRVDKEKITAAFAEGFINNAPHVVSRGEGRRFLALFTDDFVRGDTVDLQLGADGTVTASLNGKVLGSVKSGRLVNGILAIYFGERPADEGLKKGMLGGS